MTLSAETKTDPPSVGEAVDAARGANHGPVIVDESVPSDNRGDSGARLRTARLGAGLSQEQLADGLGVSRKTVLRWERGDGAPDLGEVAAICRVCGVSADWLLFGRGPGDTEPTPPALPLGVSHEDPASDGADELERELRRAGLATGTEG